MIHNQFDIHNLLSSGRSWPDISPGLGALIDDLVLANSKLRAAREELGVMRDLLGLVADRTGSAIVLTEAELTAMPRGRDVSAFSDARDNTTTITFTPVPASTTGSTE